MFVTQCQLCQGHNVYAFVKCWISDKDWMHAWVDLLLLSGVDFYLVYKTFNNKRSMFKLWNLISVSLYLYSIHGVTDKHLSVCMVWQTIIYTVCMVWQTSIYTVCKVWHTSIYLYAWCDRQSFIQYAWCDRQAFILYAWRDRQACIQYAWCDRVFTIWRAFFYSLMIAQIHFGLRV